MLPVAREFQAVFVFITLIIIGVHFFLTPAPNYLWVPWLIFLLFIRDFRRDSPPIPRAVISPADGQITEVIQTQDPFLDRLSTRYSLSQSLWGEFNIHTPIEGRVEELWVYNTKKQRKCLAFSIQSDEEGIVVVEIELKPYIQHASTHIHPGERVGQGKRCGFAAMGCKVNIYLPKTTTSVGQIDERVKAGKDVLANLSSSKKAS